MKDGDTPQTGPVPKSCAGDPRLARHPDKDGGLLFSEAIANGLMQVNRPGATLDILIRAGLFQSYTMTPASPPRLCSEISVPAGGLRLRGELYVPAGAGGVVVLARGGGDCRSASSRSLARVLQGAGLATVSLDLLEEHETHDRHNVWDVELHGQRLVEAVRWLGMRPDMRGLRVGYFGAGAGAGAALLAAAREPKYVSAVVSGGGRPATALRWLPRVGAPTLLVVGERDLPGLECSDRVLACLGAKPKELVLVPDALNLLDEPDELEALAAHARRWFTRFLAPAAVPETAEVE
jgi:putative phosphoribosyl transferase